MVDPNRKINRVDEERNEMKYLLECEEEFANRYKLDEDDEYRAHCEAAQHNQQPPIVFPWQGRRMTFGGGRGGGNFNNHRGNNFHHRGGRGGGGRGGWRGGRGGDRGYGGGGRGGPWRQNNNRHHNPNAPY